MGKSLKLPINGILLQDVYHAVAKRVGFRDRDKDVSDVQKNLSSFVELIRRYVFVSIGQSW